MAKNKLWGWVRKTIAAGTAAFVLGHPGKIAMEYPHGYEFRPGIRREGMVQAAKEIEFRNALLNSGKGEWSEKYRALLEPHGPLNRTGLPERLLRCEAFRIWLGGEKGEVTDYFDAQELYNMHMELKGGNPKFIGKNVPIAEQYEAVRPGRYRNCLNAAARNFRKWGLPISEAELLKKRPSPAPAQGTVPALKPSQTPLMKGTPAAPDKIKVKPRRKKKYRKSYIRPPKIDRSALPKRRA
ncbi:MAG: hypothetical protein ABH854_05625 [Candidatus Diapherotrites archaeon]|nr:hypothetical protein [Candidatus Micrarchaeota archaeon]MBU1940029.1 hypothetical protein [Candidatus Micrarchaeota archaeon]